MQIRQLFDKAAHVGIGVWVGSGINNPEYRHGLYMVAGAFLAYQVLGAWRKGDCGFHEVKEFGIGLALPLALRRLERSLEPKD